MPALVHHTSVNGVASGTAITIPSTTSGNCIVVAVGIGSTTTISSVKLGSTADNFSQLAGRNTVAGLSGYIWADPNCAGGQTSVTVTDAAGSTVSGDIYEFSGVVSSSVLDQSSTGDNGSLNTNFDSGSTPTTTSANEVWVGMGATFAVVTLTGPGGSWTNEAQTGDITVAVIGGYQIVSSTGVARYNGSWSGGPASGSEGLVVTLKAGVNINLSPFAVTIAFNPILGLIAAMAPVAGTDPVGNAFAAGFTGPITAFKPATSPTVVETWHNVTPPAGWTGTLRYKLLAQTNMAVIDFDLTHAGAASPLSLLTVPGTYSPAGNVYRPCIVFTSPNVACQAEIDTTGAVTVTWASGNATRIGGTLYYPLD